MAADASGIYNTNAASNVACTVNSGIANFEIEGAVIFGGNTAGFALRKVADNDFITVGLTSTAVIVQTREAGIETTAATVAATNTSGRKYTLRAAVYGNLIDVYLDGVKVLSHTLSAPNQTLYGAATAHGTYLSGSSTVRVRWARIRSLV